LKDQTVVTGDSLGHTQFWDGDMCTLIQSFDSHQADVLALAIDENAQAVYSTGVDSVITQFTTVTDENGNLKWVQTDKVRASKHDVKALCFCPAPFNCLVSGGINPRLVTHKVEKFDTPSFVQHSLLPHQHACQLAQSANLLAYRDEHAVHVWKLGTPAEKNGEKGKLPQKVAMIKSRKPDHLICSAISNNGQYVAYSSIKKAQLLELTYDDDVALDAYNDNEMDEVEEEIGPQADLKKCGIKVPPAYHMCFTHKTNKLVSVGHEKNIVITDIDNKSSTQIPFPDTVPVQRPFKLLCIDNSDEYICIVDVASNVLVFSQKGNRYIASLPNLGEEVITSCTFSPAKSGHLFVLTNKLNIYEYDIVAGKFDQWLLDVNKSGTISSQLNKSIMRSSQKTLVPYSFNIRINPRFPDEIFIQHSMAFGKLTHC